MAESTSPSSPSLPAGFHWLEVADIRSETRDAVSVQLCVPKALCDSYRFLAGQYITVMREINGENLRRPYSLCVSPAEQEWRFCCKYIPGGRMSGFINNELSVGEQLAVMVPNGRFTCELDDSAAHHYVGLAGGSGITPVIALLKSVLRKETNSLFTLFYGNRATPDIIFRETLLDLKNQYLDRLQVFHVLSDEQTDAAVFHGMLDNERVESLVSQLTMPTDIDRFFICGPGPMMDGAEQALLRLGVDAPRIRKESFGQAAPQAGAAQVDIASSAHVTAIIRTGGSTVGVDVKAGQSVLDAALAAGLDLPYACKGGVCCTCKAKLIEGTVDMVVNYGLEADEVERGYVLTCQAIPTSDKVVVDFDA